MELTFALGGVGADDLPAAPAPSAVELAAPEDAPASSSEFAAFSRVGDRIAATTGKLKKIEILSDYFRTLDEDALPVATLYLAGRAFAQSDPRVLNVGGAVIKRALQAVSGQSEEALRRLRTSLADLSEVADSVLPGRTRPEPFSLVASMKFFRHPRTDARPAGQGRTSPGNARPAGTHRGALRHQDSHGRTADRPEGRAAGRGAGRGVRPARRRHP